MRRRLALLAGLMAAALAATPAMAITSGQPDNGEHPYVGQLIFYVPDAQDPRFNDPGAWFNCSGTLLTPTIVLTAGHCAFGIGHDGTDVWFTVSEEADYVGLPPSSTFVPDGNDDRYDAWSAFFDSNDEWVSATAYPHPDYDDNAFFFHDLGVLVLDEPINLDDYGQLPTLDYLDQFAGGPNNTERFEAVGYGLEQSRVNLGLGGDTRRKADVMLINLHAHPEDSYAVFSANKGKAHQGGTCFGDSGGPVLHDVGDEEIVVAVNSWAQNYSCAGKTGGYRVDQPDDLEWLLEEFGVSAENTGDPA
ncbi:MAG TPA: trypsin-like serine protease [Candidatus Limnocylindrales bacterium]|nr:trypsin-like serine protease [Candidatus Limnocylindrales bacterium]